MTPQPVKINLWTTQLAKWRAVPKNLRLIDTSIKSGITFLAPTWRLLSDYKSKKVSEEEYTDVFFKLMDARVNDQAEHIREILMDALDEHDGLVLACYCGAGKFCHRLLLAQEVFKKHSEALGLDVTYHGELP